MQLRGKQILRTFYGVSEKPFRRYVRQAERMPGVTGDNLLLLLESRLDNVVYRAGLTLSRAQARQLVGQRHFTVNGRPVDIPSYRVQPGDVISVREKSRNLAPIVEAIEVGARVAPRWLEVNFEERTVKVLELPAREEIDVPGDEQVVVEFYSR
jgi:small subunit ribosomal protein S4